MLSSHEPFDLSVDYVPASSWFEFRWDGEIMCDVFTPSLTDISLLNSTHAELDEIAVQRTNYIRIRRLI